MYIFLLPQAVDRAAKKYPEREAVRYLDESITYAELADRSDRLARFLVDQGVGRGDRVGIFCFKSVEAVIAIWGIMKAGAAYVPIDPLSPTSRLKAICRDCQIEHLVTDSEKRPAVRDSVLNGVDLKTIIGPALEEDEIMGLCQPWEDVFRSPAESQLQKLQIIEQDLAYIMYTSGSTGTPKGIMHTHHSALCVSQWACGEYEVTYEDRIANHAPFHFDISLFDIFGSAITGACLVLIPKELTLFPFNFSQVLQDERITILFTVPFALIQLSLRGVLDQRDLSALRWIIYGGEPFPPKHLRNLMNQIPTCRFSNSYGPAEVAGVTFYHVPPIPKNSTEPIPIGKMCGFAQSIVVDENDQEVPGGEVGEILVRTPSIMQGYWGRPDLNRRVFYRRETAPQVFETFYRTGDLVKMLPDGNLVFIGRKDRQVKTRGYRVELDEVESALVSHSGIEEAAVFTIRDDDGNNLIHAAVLSKTGEKPLDTVLFAHLNELIPPYAVPVEIHFMEAFPRTTSGKISRRELQRFVMGSDNP